MSEFRDGEYGNFLEGPVNSPERTDININMMPYISVGYESEEYKLPPHVEPYFPLIRFCGTVNRNYDPSLKRRKIFYLTIQEGWVEPNESQGRPGIHTDNAGCITITEGDEIIGFESAHCGGGSRFEDGREGGIYMTSNVSN